MNDDDNDQYHESNGDQPQFRLRESASSEFLLSIRRAGCQVREFLIRQCRYGAVYLHRIVVRVANGTVRNWCAEKICDGFDVSLPGRSGVDHLLLHRLGRDQMILRGRQGIDISRNGEMNSEGQRNDGANTKGGNKPCFHEVSKGDTFNLLEMPWGGTEFAYCLTLRFGRTVRLQDRNSLVGTLLDEELRREERGAEAH